MYLTFSLLIFLTIQPKLQGEPAYSHLLSEPTELISGYYLRHTKITKNQTLASTLRQFAFDENSIFELNRGFSDFIDLRRLSIGTKITGEFRAMPLSKVTKIVIRPSKTKTVIANMNLTKNWEFKSVDIPITEKVKSYSGVVALSFWESAQKAGMNPNLIGNLSEIFAWQIDFAKQVQSGDKWRLSVTEKYADDQFIGYGPITAAEYINSGRKYDAIYFKKNPNSRYGSYFDSSGRSLKRMFLKSPLNYKRISSGFKRKRFHPVLGYTRAHNGVDYAAKSGTPVKTVGDGTIISIGWMGSGGRTIKIKHNRRYATAYLHLRGFARGLRKDSKVRQGQVIGYVGSSGLATGPHLHFSFYENGKYVNPTGRRFPAKDPLPSKQLSKFKNIANNAKSTLKPWKI